MRDCYQGSNSIFQQEQPGAAKSARKRQGLHGSSIWGSSAFSDHMMPCDGENEDLRGSIMDADDSPREEDEDDEDYYAIQ